jgi:hypothetical protein
VESLGPQPIVDAEQLTAKAMPLIAQKVCDEVGNSARRERSSGSSDRALTVIPSPRRSSAGLREHIDGTLVAPITSWVSLPALAAHEYSKRR